MFKKLIFTFTSLFIGSLFFIQCNNDDTFETKTEDVITENGTIELTSPIKVGPETRATTYFITAKFDAEAEKLISYSVSSELLTLIGMSSEQLDNCLKEKMGVIYDMQSTPATRGAHADCITECYNNFTNPDGSKKKGRGSCKAGCWVDSAVRVI